MNAEQNDPGTAAGTRIALVTLGMHRSGTSALSGVLARLGCDTPATPMASDARNTKGFYESRPISELNNVILNSAGTSWDDWSAVAPAWFDSPRRAGFAGQALDLVRSEFGASPLIVLKDPRISLLVPLWFDVLARAGCETRVVFACRAAADVGASLAERNTFDPALGRLLWLRYVLEGERASRGVPRVFVGYDRLLSDWRAETARIEAGLGLRLPRQSPRAMQEVEAFLTPSMRHHAAGAGGRGVEAAAPGWIRDVQAILERWTRDGEEARDHPVLDRIRAEFDVATPAFDPLLRLAKGRAASEAALTARLTEAETEIGTRAQAARQDREAFGRAEARLGALEADLAASAEADAARQAELAALRADLERRAEVLLGYEQEADDLNTAVAELSRSQVDLQEDLHVALQAAERQRAESDGALAESEAALAGAQAEIDRILNSRSIRLTAPLRRLRFLAGGG